MGFGVKARLDCEPDAKNRCRAKSPCPDSLTPVLESWRTYAYRGAIAQPGLLLTRLRPLSCTFSLSKRPSDLHGPEMPEKPGLHLHLLGKRNLQDIYESLLAVPYWGCNGDLS